MDSPDPDLRLNQIATLWSVVHLAHADAGTAMQDARATLLTRYSGAIRRYLLGALRDADAADELAQEFAFRFLHGDLKGADRQRGRFRDFVKGVLFHLVADYHQKRKRLPGQFAEDAPEPGADCALAAQRDENFRTSWRDELLARAWLDLERLEKEQGQLYFTLLRYRSEHPDESSEMIAENLSRQLQRPLTAANVRQTLRRARNTFADFLLDEIGQAIDSTERQAIEDELSDLELLEHCRPALERRWP